MPEIHPSTELRAPDPRTAATRRRIIETSLRLFAEHGFRGVSVRDISAAAHVNVAAVNYHFGGKQGLYRTIFETVLDDDEARFAEQLAKVAKLLGHTVVDRALLRAAVEILAGGMVRRISTYENVRCFSVLLARELAFPGELFELLYRRRAAPLLDLLARVVGAAQGLSPETESVRLTANVLYGQVGHLVFSRPILWRQVDWEDYTPARLDLLTRTVIDLINRAIGLDPQDHPRADPGAVV
ncbi:CerR family C-terminal domain-containing protein [uncultured Lamprocystis sp.]|jgi:AcrR family transcriptional regulator|uniref:CerR family C-terminal domain-containing protein n=1 Tax=uncultured Lamprocystis sp. TaxID=543132 RepID=UPI0025D05F5D|nr:CerR family C-terminal domain-containing protein [uncultured Lamprocystis sp.]